MGAKGTGPLFLTDAYLSQSALEELVALPSKAAIRAKLAEGLGIDRDEGYPTEILKDFYFNNYSFCAQNSFNLEKTGAYLSIMKLVQEESFRGRLSVTESFDQLFKPWLLKHAVQRPPLGVGVFSFEDCRLITEYTLNTFFRHYKLYAYVCVPHRELELSAKPWAVSENIPWNAELRGEDEILDPRTLPELAYVFKDEQEQRAKAMADAMFDELDRNQALGQQAQEVKTILDQKVAALVESYEQKLQEQDERFQAMIEGGGDPDA